MALVILVNKAGWSKKSEIIPNVCSLHCRRVYVAIEADPVVLFPRMQPGPRTTRDGSPSVPAAAVEQRWPGFPGSRQAHTRAVLAAVPPVSRPAAAAVVVSIKLGPSLRLCSVFQSSTAVDSEHTGGGVRNSRMDWAASAVPRSTFKGWKEVRKKICQKQILVVFPFFPWNLNNKSWINIK